MKPTLHVPGVDPARIKCYVDGKVQRVWLDSAWVACLEEAGIEFNSGDDPASRAVMNATIDHWRATGRLFPEPTPEPVECVCGGKPKLCSSVDLPVAFVVCIGVSCNLRANTVAQWNTIQAALKAAKK